MPSVWGLVSGTWSSMAVTVTVWGEHHFPASPGTPVQVTGLVPPVKVSWTPSLAILPAASLAASPLASQVPDAPSWTWSKPLLRGDGPLVEVSGSTQIVTGPSGWLLSATV